MPHIVRRSRAWANLDRGDSWAEAAGAQEEDHHHAHRKPLGGKVFIHQLVCGPYVGIKMSGRSVIGLSIGTLKNTCSGQGWQLRPKDSPSLHRAGLRQLVSAKIP